jgi:hypothetical protein
MVPPAKPYTYTYPVTPAVPVTPWVPPKKSKFREVMSELFNWKKHPASVFYLVAPLFLLGLVLCLLEALVYGFTQNDWGYLIVFVCMTPLMAMPTIMLIRFKQFFEKNGHF